MARGDLDAEAVGVAEERRVVALVALRPAARGVQDLGACRKGGRMDGVDLLLALDESETWWKPGA